MIGHVRYWLEEYHFDGFRFDGVTESTGPNYRAARGIMDVSKNGVHDSTMYPEKRVYNAGGMPMTNAAIDSGPFGDIYVSMGEPVAAAAGAEKAVRRDVARGRAGDNVRGHGERQERPGSPDRRIDRPRPFRIQPCVI